MTDAPAPQQVMNYASATPENRYATPALIAGLLGILIPFVGAIVALILGRRAMRVARETPQAPGRSMAQTALILGVIGILFWSVAAIAAVPALRQARRQRDTVACLSNLRSISQSVFIYAAQSKGHVPESLDQIVAAGVLPKGAVYDCPACARVTGKPVATTGAFGNYSYVYLGTGQRMSDVRSAATTPLAYEPLTNHDGRSINVAFFDGHVECLTGAPATAFLAGNPPPATRPASTPVQAVEQ